MGDVDQFIKFYALQNYLQESLKGTKVKAFFAYENDIILPFSAKKFSTATGGIRTVTQSEYLKCFNSIADKWSREEGQEV